MSWHPPGPPLGWQINGGQLGLFDPPPVARPVLPYLVHVLFEPSSRFDRDPDAPFHLVYSPGCRTCGWYDDGFYWENYAVEAALDHAWPGWRQLPAVEQMPGTMDKARRQRHLDKATAGYPHGWVKAGGPVRTIREAPGNRHHWCAINRYWDIAAPPPSEPLVLF